MVRTGTKGLTFSSGCSHGLGVRAIFGRPRKRSPSLVPVVDPPGYKGKLQFGFPPVSRSFSFFIYFLYINMQRVINCLVNKILAKKLQKEFLDLVLHYCTLEKSIT